MAGDTAPPPGEFERLQGRFNKLAEDKSYYQLILRLMELLNPLPGLEDMLRGMLLNIVECIGGTNVKVYYWIGDELHYMDFLGERRVLSAIDDETVAEVARSHRFVEQRGDAEDALLMHGMLRGSWTWTFPLLIGDQLIGVVKLENLHIHGASLGRYLPIFFSHAALILGNEIRNSIHRQSEEALQVATERLKLATEAGLIGIWDWDIPRDQLVWDDAMYRLYGRQAGDFGGAYQAWLAAVHPQDKPLADGEIQAALRGEREYGPEFRVVWPDGSIHYIKAASRTLRDVDGKPLRMVGINYDLTERHRSEERLGRLNRELRAISDCNQALIRADDEASLLAQVCRIICDEAGYRMAWVGVAERDPAKTIRPIAWAGADEGYLAVGGFSWGEGERGQGPSGCAIRRGVTAVIQDFASDPAAIPWREAALARGYRSCVALPLHDQERQAFGVLCIYAAEPDAFTPDELRLLEELAGDLAFGVVVLRTRVRRDQAEANLAASERRFRGVVENLPDLVVRYDTDLRRTYVNPEWERMSGLTAAEVLGVPVAAIPRVPRPLADDYLTALRTALETGTRQSVEFSWVNARGETLHLQYVVVPEFDEAGRVAGLLAVGRDLSERKRAEQELEQHRQHLEDLVAVRTRELAQARDAAESANRMKSIFLANMSHELRTPLNAILGFAQILERDARLADDQRHKLATIGRSGHHLLSLINDVLEISRIEAGRISAQPTAFDLPEMLEGLRDFVELRAQAKGLELRLELAASLPRYVTADSGKLRQILLNLLSNAVKYTEAGRIVLSAATRAEAGKTRLEFAVRDTGVGIAPAELERIFQPFHQTDYGAALGEGTGLGLTISRQYAQLLGGSLTVESQPNVGSVFRLSLPFEPAVAPAPVPVTRGLVVGLAADQPRYRVLVVEDDADSCYLLEELLRQVDFQVRSAANGEEAVAAFQSWHPHFVWMDMRMPVMDGYEATRRIRALPGGNQVRIAALTASAFLEDRDGMVAAGCDVVLAKPLDEVQLFATMERLLGLRFRYADEVPTAAGGDAEWDLSAVPAALRAELAAAARCLDAEAVSQILARIRQEDSSCAAGLEDLIKAYRYDRIVSLCEER